MADYGLIESFQCDDGQLDGLSPAMCFTLGYEFAEICHALKLFRFGNRGLVHVENVERLNAAAAKRGRKVTWRYYQEDQGESWVQMTWES